MAHSDLQDRISNELSLKDKRSFSNRLKLYHFVLLLQHLKLFNEAGAHFLTVATAFQQHSDHPCSRSQADYEC